MSLSALDIMNLLPMMILAGGMLLTMLLIAVKRDHTVVFSSTLITLSASFLTGVFSRHDMPHAVGELFRIDRFGVYYQSLILSSAFVVVIFSYINIKNTFLEKRKEEYYLIVMLATLGASMMVVSEHFVSFFVSLEILTISLYAMISYYREHSNAIEAGLKYLMMAAMSSAFLLFGMALIYATTGTMTFHGLAKIAPAVDAASMVMMVVGVGMMIVAIGFKLGLAPFHMWAPDVYQGASSPASSFIATISKGAMLAVLLRFFAVANLYRFENIVHVFGIIAVISMLIGNLLALMQNDIKRMLAYSSIAHFGYLLMAVLVGKELGMDAATFYITVYIIAVLIAFGTITLMSGSGADASHIEKYKGLIWRNPLLATLFAIALLSLAGIPLTAGFMAKFYLLNAGVGNAEWLLAFTLIIGSVVGLFYYLRIIVTMMRQDEFDIPTVSMSSGSSLTGIVILSLLAMLIVWLGIHPGWINIRLFLPSS